MLNDATHVYCPNCQEIQPAIFDAMEGRCHSQAARSADRPHSVAARSAGRLLPRGYYSAEAIAERKETRRVVAPIEELIV